MQSMTLLGAEEVAQAGRSMRGAADEMSRAAANIDNSVSRLIRAMDDALQRYEQKQKRVADEREEWEKWALREQHAYRDERHGLIFFDHGAAGPSWAAWWARSQADER